MRQCKKHAFNLFLSIIPTWLSNPMAYLPKFSPLCAPDNTLNPTTSALIFYFCSFTSIQCAIIPRNPAFVVSADQPSEVIETFPGATYSSTCQLCADEVAIFLWLCLPSAFVCTWQTGYEGTPSHHKYLEDQMWSLLASWQQEHFKMQDYWRVWVAAGALLFTSVIQITHANDSLDH